MTIKKYNSKLEMEKLMKEAFDNNKFVLHNDHQPKTFVGQLTIIDMPKTQETKYSKLLEKVRNDTATEKEFRQFIKLQFGIDE